MSVLLSRRIVKLGDHLVLQLFVERDGGILKVSLRLEVVICSWALDSVRYVDYCVRIPQQFSCLVVEKLKFQPKRCDTLLNRDFEMHGEARYQLYILILNVF